MNICLKNMVANNLAELRGKRWKGMNPTFCVQTLNDAIKILLEAKDEDLHKVRGEMKKFLVADEFPLEHFGTIRMK